MNKFIFIAAIAFYIACPAFAKTIYLAPDGDDGSPGTITEPFATFAKASSMLNPGDTLLVRGGRYSQILDFPRSGSPGNPITVMAFPGERVVITALEPLSGWEHDQGDVYKTTVNWNLGQENFVMHGDTACDLARWPNNEDGNLFTLNSLRNTGGSTGDVISDAFLDYSPGIPDHDWSRGGSIFFYGDKGGGGWIAWKSFIKTNTTTRLTFNLNKNPDWIRTWHAPADFGDFFLEGIREALDYQNEWFFDESARVLYIQLPGGTEPADSAVFMRKRTHTIKLDEDYLVVKDLEVFGGSISITGNHNLLYGVKSRWGNHHRGIMSFFATGTMSVYIGGSYNTVEKCDIGYGAATGVKLSGSHNRLTNSFIHNFNFLGSYDAPVMARDGVSSVLSHCTVTRGGRDAVHMSNNYSVMSYNDVSRSNLITDDCALFYCTSGHHYITIHHNWFHDTWSRGKLRKAAGIYLDSSPKGFTVHHNVVWNTEWSSIQMNKDARDIQIYNNTLLNGSTAIGTWHAEGTHFERVVVHNNLADNNGWDTQTDPQNNLMVNDETFVNFAGRDFQLKPGSAAIDYGREITGFTEGYTGSGPDAGAYEFGQPRWTAGIDWDYKLGHEVCLDSDIYEEVNGLVVIEAESAETLGKGWVARTDLPAQGTAYLEYSGPDEPTGVVDSTISTWKVRITNPGTYRFLIRSRNGTAATGPEQQNSSWLNIEADEFYGRKIGSEVLIDSQFVRITVHDTSGWSWVSNSEHGSMDSLALFARFNYSGIYTVSLAGRSTGHLVDRIALFQEGREDFIKAAAQPESFTGCDSYTPVNQWAAPKQMNIDRKSTAYIVDGSMDVDWKDVPEEEGKYSLLEGDPPAESDLSFSFRIAANDSALFLFARIVDDVLTPDDNLELFLNPDNKQIPLGMYGDDGIHIRMNYGERDQLTIGNGSWKANDFSGFECATKDSTGGYTLEARIPWKGIYPFDVDTLDSRNMGLEVQVNDYDLDPDIKNKLSWANNTGIDLSMFDTRKFGTLGITLFMEPVPVSGVEIGMDTLILNPGQSVTLSATVLPENADNKTVTWKDLDATVVNLHPSWGTAKGLYPGQTFIIVTTQDGGFTDTCLVIVPDPNAPTQLDDLEWLDPASHEVSLIPNPAGKSFRIAGIPGWTTLQIYSITGELVSTFTRPNTPGEIKIEHLQPGLYLVRIRDHGHMHNMKLIKSSSGI